MVNQAIFWMIIIAILASTFGILLYQLRTPETSPDLSLKRLNSSNQGFKIGLFLLAGGAMALYFYVGRPDLIKQASESPAIVRLQEIVQELENYLKTDPGDLRAIYLLADSYKALGRYQEALVYYQQLESLAKQQNITLPAEYYALVAETRITLYGLLDPPVSVLLTQALMMDSKNLRARFYQAVLQAERGQIEMAIQQLRQLQNDVPANKAWLEVINQQLRRLGVLP